MSAGRPVRKLLSQLREQNGGSAQGAMEENVRHSQILVLRKTEVTGLAGGRRKHSDDIRFGA